MRIFVRFCLERNNEIAAKSKLALVTCSREPKDCGLIVEGFQFDCNALFYALVLLFTFRYSSKATLSFVSNQFKCTVEELKQSAGHLAFHVGCSRSFLNFFDILQDLRVLFKFTTERICTPEAVRKNLECVFIYKKSKDLKVP